MLMKEPRLVPEAPRGALTIKLDSARAKQHANRTGVSKMNSLAPHITNTVVESRMNDHLARAERARVIRSLGTQRGFIVSMRGFTGRVLVRLGEWVIPPMRRTDDSEDHVVVRLAR
jgi:hypothetical protein